MQPWLFIVVNVAIAAFVGGLTNYYAIKMLFHPREALFLFGRRVPFTPGLIPKRKSEIAASFGDVVANYLVTPAGLRDMVGRASFREGAIERVRAMLRQTAAMEPPVTPRSFGTERWGEEGWNSRKSEWASKLHQAARSGIDRLWIDQGWSTRRIADMLPGWSAETVESWASSAEALVVDALREELLSPRGQQLIRSMTSGMLDRAGGFLGALAGIFMDEDKVVARLTPVLVEQLGGSTVRSAIRGLIGKQLTEAGDWTLEQAALKLSGSEDPLEWLKGKADAILRLESRMDALEELNISSWLSRNEATWERWLEGAAAAAFELLERNMNRIVDAIELPRLVKEQIEKFPIERLEMIILSVSGKEFQAITWLGAVLGGMIGLIQSLLLLAIQ
jgi:uncharacterized membrane protein YheB (UPF0754 family)